MFGGGMNRRPSESSSTVTIGGYYKKSRKTARSKPKSKYMKKSKQIQKKNKTRKRSKSAFLEE